MAIEGTPTQLTVTPIERTWRATIDTPVGPSANPAQNYCLTINRQQYNVDQNGNKIGDFVTLPPIVLPFSTIAADTVTATVNGSPLTLAVSDLANFLQTYFDQKAKALGD